MRQLLFFFAPWCQPCRLMEKELIIPLERLVPPDSIRRIDAQAHPQIAEKYDVRRLPTAMLVENDNWVDYVLPDDLERAISFLGG